MFIEDLSDQQITIKLIIRYILGNLEDGKSVNKSKDKYKELGLNKENKLIKL